jgi:hypothetical protein
MFESGTSGDRGVINGRRRRSFIGGERSELKTTTVDPQRAVHQLHRVDYSARMAQ